MIKHVLRIALAFVIVAGIVFSQVACSQRQLDRATKASGTVAKYTGTVIATVNTLWTTGVIKDIKVKDLIAQKLKDFSISGRDFNDLIIKYSQQYGTGDVPTSVWRDIIEHFDDLSKVFLDLLSSIPKLAGLQDSTAFKLISAAIVTLANLFLNVAGVQKIILKTLMRNYGEVASRLQRIKDSVDDLPAVMQLYAEAA
jgi:hypothetical protein